MDPVFLLALFAVAVLSGATASMVGFGIGSMVTPLLALRLEADVAVAAVALPHALATALRCWRLRKSIDLQILRGFGILSAAGGLGGALAHAWVSGPTLTRILGGLLVLTAIAQLTGLAGRWHPRGSAVAMLGLGSGFFGGIAGNQGGLRAAALSSFALPPAVFVATSTATGLMVDAARTPVYLVTAGRAVIDLAGPIAIATAGVLAGTLLGERLLLGVPKRIFAHVVATAIGTLGVWLLLRP